MSFFLIGFFLVFFLIWILSRKSIRHFIIDNFKLSPRFLYIYDVLLLGSSTVSVLVRMTVFDSGPIITNILRLHYFLMGLSWLLALFYLVSLVVRKSVGHKFDESRRELFKRNLGLGGVGLVLTATTVGAVQAISPELERVTVKLPLKFKNLSGLRIIQISDIHIGPTLKKEFFDHLVRKVNELDGDIVVITGDMVDGTVAAIGEDLAGLADIRAKLGVYYVTGNHEYYWGGLDWINLVKSKGIRVFENDSVNLEYNGESFSIGGVFDLKATRFESSHTCSPEKVFAKDDRYKILLAHQPKSCYLAEGLGINLQLSGHTHGGQGMPWNLLVGLVQPYLKGLYKHKDMDLYVNRGTGFWGPPYRLGIPGEITELTLKA